MCYISYNKHSSEEYKGPMDKAKGGKDGRWEVRVGKGGSGGGEIETTVFEQQQQIFFLTFQRFPMLFSITKFRLPSMAPHHDFTLPAALHGASPHGLISILRVC